MQFHKKHKKLVTMTAAIPEGRFGSITFKGDRISTIKEKQDNSDKFVNAGFFVVNKEALKYIKNLGFQRIILKLFQQTLINYTPNIIIFCNPTRMVTSFNVTPFFFTFYDF